MTRMTSAIATDWHCAAYFIAAALQTFRESRPPNKKRPHKNIPIMQQTYSYTCIRGSSVPRARLGVARSARGGFKRVRDTARSRIAISSGNVTRAPRPEPLTDRRSIRRPTDRAPRLPLGYPPKDSKDVLKGCRGSAPSTHWRVRRGGSSGLLSVQFRLHYPPPAQDPCYSPPLLSLACGAAPP